MRDVAVMRAEPRSLASLVSPPRLLADLWRHRDLAWQLTLREVLARNKGSSLGIVWTVIVPLLTFGVYAFIFGVVFTSRWSFAGGGPSGGFVLPMFCGATLFNVFSECIMRAPSLVLERPNYVKRVVFPLEILPLSVLGATLILAAINVGVLLVVEVATLGRISATLHLFPLVLVPLSMLSLGLAWFVASLGVFIRDIRNVVALFVSPVLFFMSPVFYPVEQIPERFRPIVMANPLTPILEDGRATLLWGGTPHWRSWAVVTLFSMIIMQLGYAWFMKTKRGFADVV